MGLSVTDTRCSNQEEADTRVILHAIHALSSNQYGDVIIRSHSGDTDTLRERVDNKTGKNKKVIRPSDVEFSSSEKCPFRASCIFRKRLHFLFFPKKLLVGRFYAIILDILTPLLT